MAAVVEEKKVLTLEKEDLDRGNYTWIKSQNGFCVALNQLDGLEHIFAKTLDGKYRLIYKGNHDQVSKKLALFKSRMITYASTAQDIFAEARDSGASEVKHGEFCLKWDDANGTNLFYYRDELILKDENSENTIRNVMELMLHFEIEDESSIQRMAELVKKEEFNKLKKTIKTKCNSKASGIIYSEHNGINEFVISVNDTHTIYKLYISWNKTTPVLKFESDLLDDLILKYLNLYY